MKDKKIFVYLRLRDDTKLLIKSRIREFAAIGKLLADFMKEIWEKFGFQMLKFGNLEYVDANSDLTLISFRHDIIRQKIIICGLIPTEYRQRMLNSEETNLNIPLDDFIDNIAFNLNSLHKEVIRQKIQNPPINVLGCIKNNIDNNGEFYFTLDANLKV